MIPSPNVTVITPTKNRLKVLCEAIDSVRAQTIAEWEHIIVDDGSKDGTAEEMASIGAADPRIRYLKRPPGISGANACRNLGIRESRADLILFLDSDDLLSPECLQTRIEIMHRNLDLDFAVFRGDLFLKSVGDMRRLYHALSPGDNLLRFLSLDCPWGIPGPIWRRGFLEMIGCFDETLMSMQDLEMHVRAISARGKYLCFPDVDHHVRSHSDGSNTSVRHFIDPIYIQASEKTPALLLSTVRESGLLTWTRQRALTGLYFRAAGSWAQLGYLGRAMEAWIKGCRHDRAPLNLQFSGIAMLFIGWLGHKEMSICSRLVNKWKGFVRFRLEPSLIELGNEGATGGPKQLRAQIDVPPEN